MTGTLQHSGSDYYHWSAIGEWEQRRAVRSCGLMFAFEGIEEEAVRWKTKHIDGINLDNFDDVEVPESSEDIVEELLDWDEKHGYEEDQTRGLFYLIMASYGYTWSEEVYSPENMLPRVRALITVFKNGDKTQRCRVG